MNILIPDEEGLGLDFAMRCKRWGHSVKVWRPCGHTGDPCPIGQGLIDRVDDWEPWVNWADLIVLTGNSMYRDDFQRLIDQDYPVLGANDEAASLELDRAKGQEVLEDAGIDTAPYETFTSLDKALAYVQRENRGFAIKPWGGTADKALTCVAKSAREAIFMLQDWKRRKLKGELMVQELVQGTEMGVSGWFGPGGWCSAVEEDWEEKKFMNGGLGCNTGEQGTIVRYVRKSKLFNLILEPLTEYLHSIRYVGNINVNCIIDEKGKPWPLEFTMRLGWPAFCIHMALQLGDPAQWMLDLLNGRDTLKVSSNIAVGVVLTHGNYPAKTPVETSEGQPLYLPKDRSALHFQCIKAGVGPDEVDGKVKDCALPVSAGDYLMVVTGTGATVREAQKKAYSATKEVETPSNLMYRTDIGDRLKKELPVLQAHGFARGMAF